MEIGIGLAVLVAVATNLASLLKHRGCQDAASVSGSKKLAGLRDLASSRWFDFRHHGFDILFGFFIGTVTAVFSFRYYHLPIGRGAGWAWGPRSRDKAFWAGVGSFSFATDREMHAGFYGGEVRAGDEEEALGNIPRGANGSGRAGDIEAVGRKTNRVEDDARV